MSRPQYGSASAAPRRRAQRVIGDPQKRNGLTGEQVAWLLAAQDNKCVLCERPLTSQWAVDHDHLLARQHGHVDSQMCIRCVRGILCYGCNSWLAGFRDDPSFIRRALAYVLRRRKDA